MRTRHNTQTVQVLIALALFFPSSLLAQTARRAARNNPPSPAAPEPADALPRLAHYHIEVVGGTKMEGDLFLPDLATLHSPVFRGYIHWTAPAKYVSDEFVVGRPAAAGSFELATVEGRISTSFYVPIYNYTLTRTPTGLTGTIATWRNPANKGRWTAVDDTTAANPSPADRDWLTAGDRDLLLTNGSDTFMLDANWMSHRTVPFFSESFAAATDPAIRKLAALQQAIELLRQVVTTPEDLSREQLAAARAIAGSGDESLGFLSQLQSLGQNLGAKGGAIDQAQARMLRTLEAMRRLQAFRRQAADYIQSIAPLPGARALPADRITLSLKLVGQNAFNGDNRAGLFVLKNNGPALHRATIVYRETMDKQAFENAWASIGPQLLSNASISLGAGIDPSVILQNVDLNRTWMTTMSEGGATTVYVEEWPADAEIQIPVLSNIQMLAALGDSVSAWVSADAGTAVPPALSRDALRAAVASPAPGTPGVRARPASRPPNARPVPTRRTRPIAP
jgi:hypothetical protein